ncbi:synaptonemal complex protein 2 [Echeneis naucrates]|uniref:synaptonemal complex protein 2 n=1 Tax=Echeneis naucrates TaxID=173247 RepID=UPI001113CE5C|nr:synaptonemal complex protein 2 [Echeneis naucrates]
MASGQDTQLEKIINEVLKDGNVCALDVFLQRGMNDETSMKCSKQFLSKLDKLVCWYLDQKDPQSASLCLAVVHKCGEKLKLLNGSQGVSGLIGQGLINKMVQWFEKCRQLWIQGGPQWDEALFNLSEDFFDALMVVHEASNEGKYKITESFLYPVGQLGVEPRIYILIQKEAIRKFNLILDKIPVGLTKEMMILTSQEASDIMMKLARQILEGGDYDLQTASMEALCRMATPEQRKGLANKLFKMEHVANAFVKICDSEFETDCRKFLNFVNGIQGVSRRVISYPCLEVYLGKYELLMPADEKLEEFWIDFNHGSRSISFYFSLADEEVQEAQWETICINENEVQSFTVTEEDKEKILQLKLSEVVIVGVIEGSNLTIHFSSSLDILQAACGVFGPSKNKSFVGKMGTSVVKTTVKVIMEENSSQVVSESQVSLAESAKNTAPYALQASCAPIQMVTPAKMRISESATFISNSAGRSVQSASSLSAVNSTSTPARSKSKPSLEMVRSCERKGELGLGELSTVDKSYSHGTALRSTAAACFSERNIPLAKAADGALAGLEEQQSQEDNFVPDTQPRTVRNISSHWRKFSVSEMLTMPTQKINTLPKPELQSDSAQCQEQPRSALRSSVPGSGSISQKQLHTELTKRLQQVLRKQNEDQVPEQSAKTQGKRSHIRGDSKGRNSTDQFVSTLCTFKAQQAQKKGLATGRSKAQISLEANVPPHKAPVKISTAKVLQEKMAPSAKAETHMALSSKEKRDAEVAQSMVKHISSHYETNTNSSTENVNLSWKAPLVNRKGVFDFSTDTSLTLGGKDKPSTNSSAISSSGIHDSPGLYSKAKKGQPVKKEKRYVKRHLFSDTDTDYATTEVSWLRDSSRKPKPKVTKYSRQAPIKPTAVSPHTSYESPDLPPLLPRRGKTKTNPKPNVKKPETVKPTVEPPQPRVADRRPRRAAASAKSYREPETDESQSESEESPALKQRPKNVCQSTLTLNKNGDPVLEEMNALKDSFAAHQTSFCPSAPFIERMRSAERSAPTLGLTCSPLLTPRGSPLPSSPGPACCDTPLPILLLDKPCSTVSNKEYFKPSSFYSPEKKCSTSKTQSIPPVPSLPPLRGQTPVPSPPIVLSAAELNQECLSPAPRSSLSLSTLPLLTSTALDLDKIPVLSQPQSPFQEDTVNCNHFYGFSEVSSVSKLSLNSSSKSSVLTSRVKDRLSTALTVSHKREKTPSSERDVKPAQPLMSGPSYKRYISSSSDSEEDEKEERKKCKMRGQHSPRMKPRKLFKSFSEVSAAGGMSRVMSSSHMMTSSHWLAEVDGGDIDMNEDLETPETALNPSSLCQQFSSDLKKKLQNRQKMMEVYSKQSLKTVQQHVSSLNMQVSKHRSQRLAQVQRVLQEEIHKLEQEDTVLKRMEKDHIIHWKEQTLAFRSYNEQETRRNETLKTALQSKVSHSLEYEQRIFTSQMCLIRNDMKSVQDRLLSEMQEGEIQGVKRGLHALFFPAGTKF